ncbi:MAG: hypothetical protein CL677_00545 [Bdellovibrionaceae bacterium]|nr:hypothetical protein [Pseudobdellovibrionaceae bacterium]|tara:strand:- start:94 stop:957 length:864 start_codon:yes stop_codon:yes gene_type:complete
MLNFKHLYYFSIVAREGSIKTAAEKLNVSQPTISDQLKLLEEYFDCPLFDRRNRGLHLTRHGEMAVRFSNEIFALGQELTAQLRSHSAQPKNSIDVGISHYISPYFSYEFLLPLFKKGDVHVNFHENEKHLLLADLEEGALDMVFINQKENIPSSMKSYRVGTHKTYALAHKQLAQIAGTSFPANLQNIPFFNYGNESYLKYELELFFANHEISPKTIGESDDLDLLQLVAERGLAFVVVPEPAKQRIAKNKDIVVLGELEELETYIWGIVKKSDQGIGYQLLTKKL